MLCPIIKEVVGGYRTKWSPPSRGYEVRFRRELVEDIRSSKVETSRVSRGVSEMFDKVRDALTASNGVLDLAHISESHGMNYSDKYNMTKL